MPRPPNIANLDLQSVEFVRPAKADRSWSDSKPLVSQILSKNFDAPEPIRETLAISYSIARFPVQYRRINNDRVQIRKFIYRPLKVILAASCNPQ
jgi:hypothetical protein